MLNIRDLVESVPMQGDYHELVKSREGRDELRERGRLRGRRFARDLNRLDPDTRPFIAWDGEGITNADGSHHYVLFGNSLGKYIWGESLATKTILDFIYQTEVDNPDTYHVIYSGKYDVNMTVKDCHYLTLLKLFQLGKAPYGGYSLTYAPGKFFMLSRQGKTAKIYDVWSFFGGSLVQALKDFLTVDDTIRDIEREKARRNSFTWAEFSRIKTYMFNELEYTVRLMNKLRDHLLTAELPITQWHGPGAIASKIMRKYDIKNYMQETPREVLPYVQHAYAGGWAEQFQGGLYLGPVYQYDINSAYPAYIAELPSLYGSEYVHRASVGNVVPYGIYHVKARTVFDPTRDAQPYPLFWRGGHSEVYYPRNLEGWYWGSEILGVMQDPHAYTSFDILEAYELKIRDETKPFRYIYELYEQRREWKQSGNPAHFVLKVGYNSHYGKHAQRVAFNKGRPPTWHQLEWAGMTTAGNRAAIYAASLGGRGAIISIATDALFTTVPLDLPLSGKLGQWEHTYSTGILQLQSGVYWLRHAPNHCPKPEACEDGWHAKYRGFDKGVIKIEDAYRYLEDIDRMGVDHPPFGVGFPSTRFMTWGQTHGGPNWRRWRTEPRVLNFHQLGGKRVHNARVCRACAKGQGYTEGLHPFHTQPDGTIGASLSARHYLPWVDPEIDPNLPPDEGIEL